MIRSIVRLPMLHIVDLGAWIVSPLVHLGRSFALVLKTNPHGRDDQPGCHEYSPQGHLCREVPPSEFLRVLR